MASKLKDYMDAIMRQSIQKSCNDEHTQSIIDRYQELTEFRAALENECIAVDNLISILIKQLSEMGVDISSI